MPSNPHPISVLPRVPRLLRAPRFGFPDLFEILGVQSSGLNARCRPLGFRVLGVFRGSPSAVPRHRFACHDFAYPSGFVRHLSVIIFLSFSHPRHPGNPWSNTVSFPVTR
jgi:hypothetical protein